MTSRDTTIADADWAVTGTDQSVSDTEQTLADADQTSADSDQTSAEIDQLAAERDQAASDRDLAAGVDPGEREITRDIRQRTAHQRELSARARLDAASGRDAAAGRRDLLAIARDHAAVARDLAMAQRDAVDQQSGGRADFGMEIVLRAAEHRTRAAQYRVDAAKHRELAAADRLAAAADRERSADERLQASADREISAVALAVAETDMLTGTQTRAAGLRDLEREAARCRRTRTELVVAYIDVIGLKAINDTRGHAAGDAVLADVSRALQARLRAYDLIVRLGGDEFLCAMPGLSEAAAHERLRQVNAQLAATPGHDGITSGFAVLRADETIVEVIARADSHMRAGEGLL